MSEKPSMPTSEALQSPESLATEVAALQKQVDALKNLLLVVDTAGPEAAKQIFS
ncbi:MAG: hypothetical protein UX44_C0010G0017 [candidate division WWE3 bacterium GW2011_GWA1_46_21]|uniref:Uncharacterized protein n=4 Tax=Katanobacteria TaxID=422282 RepID=A0A0G1SC95_UNCKA|nr:MAG: hypothetical protein UX44_C0010G0017 [candidate division WWE3 bacterium GW2011_GWA1_46_21]KKU48947.1 MAG: hypothetical protein UX69_C0008G0009 [candidate division WWE3 bacterium GW2011_GWA2_46_9]KKU51081.1 MAG: hypothetical protein UX73_C0008G0022 [candidate division WWE3 bacterium GW2011_GWC1_47_10]KKU57617.1 MAG: hypothetical protein UX79_C0007G0008 [candidate division WWE3 bacterium GW2011_GWB1_47_11]